MAEAAGVTPVSEGERSQTLERRTSDAVPDATGIVLLVLGAIWLTLTGLCTWNVSQGDVSHGDIPGFWVFGLYVVGVGAIPFFLGLERVTSPQLAGMILTSITVAVMAWALYNESSAFSNVGKVKEVAAITLGPLLPFLIWGIVMWRRRPNPTAEHVSGGPT